MIKIEILFPEICSLYGDTGNVRYLKSCLPDAEFINSGLNDTLYFADNEPNLIYMGPMSEKSQELAINRLMPYKQRFQELIEKGVPMLFTGNACEVFFQYIETPEKEKIEALGILDIYAKRKKTDRYNGFVLGKFNDIDIVGFKSQFTFAYGNNEDCPFVKVERGIGLNPECKFEGIKINNTIFTYLLGPILVLNPQFTRYILDLIGGENYPLAFENEINDAFSRRLKEFNNPKFVEEY